MTARHALSRIVFLLGLGATLVGAIYDAPLPSATQLRDAVRAMPVQRSTLAAPFVARVGRDRYQVMPVADYDIAGLVVSRHDSDAWWDWIHAAANDRLNVVDLCVVYGENARTGVYRDMSFSSGQFVCYYRYGAAASPVFDGTALSNNHVLTDRASVAAVLRGVRAGDQVRLRGMLVDYGHEGGPMMRRTSTVRDDTGNGACESVWVEQVDILARASPFGRALPWLGLVGMLVAAVMWFASPMQVRD